MKLPPPSLGSRVVGFVMFLVAVFAVYALWLHQPQVITTTASNTCQTAERANPLDQAVTTFRAWFGMAGTIPVDVNDKLNCEALTK